MTDPFELDHHLTFDLLAAELKFGLSDGARSVQLLADRLTTLFPEYVKADYDPSSTSRLGTLRALTVDLGGRHLILRHSAGQLTYESTLRVHGIDLSHQPLGQEAWLRALIEAIREQNATIRKTSELDTLL